MPDNINSYVLIFCFLVAGGALLFDFFKEKMLYKIFFISGIVTAAVYQIIRLCNVKVTNNDIFVFLIIIAVFFGTGFALMYKNKKSK